MAYFTYDTSVLVSRKLTNFSELPHNFRLSAVVMMELMAGASDESCRKSYHEVFSQYRQRDQLIVPNIDDWLFASKILFLLTHARKHAQKGRLQKLPAGASQRIALDVLIAVSARRCKVQVVTENWVDFKAIQRYCNASIVKAATFFKK